MSQFMDTGVLENTLDVQFLPSHSPSEDPGIFSEGDLYNDKTEDLILVELKKGRSVRSKIHYFISCSYFQCTLFVIVAQYLKEVRVRMIESREFDRKHYHNTVYQTLSRAFRKSLQHMKKNLSR